MSDALTIKSKGTPDPPEYLDFELLRQEGLRHIQDLSGALWTDHNVHDPGITILEALCYALTDLDYRSKLSITDLLARPPMGEATPDDNFFSAAEILGNNPLTILDYRKLLIDIPGVRNAWLKASEDGGEVGIRIDKTISQLKFYDAPLLDLPKLLINGLYKIFLELEPEAVVKVDECGKRIDPTDEILAEVNRRLQAHRNLCEDFLDITVLKDERIGLCADIELKADAYPDEVMLSIIEAAREFLSPTLRFYTLREMIANGKTPDQIFEGRPLPRQNQDLIGVNTDDLLGVSHGFIDPEELKGLDLRTEIHVSDLYGILLKIPGVAAIKKLSLFNYSRGQLTGSDWVLPLNPKTHRPVLAIKESLQGITFYKRGVPFVANISAVQAAVDKLPANPKKVLKKVKDLDLAVPKGQHRPDLAEYQSIQHEFPLIYGVGPDGLPEHSSPFRKAQANQLKGYLLFYDQLLTNYVAQLANLRSVFSRNLDEKNGATTFAGDLNSVPHLDQLIRNTKQFEDSDGFIEGETIAILDTPALFSVPQDRDFALQQVLTAFDNGTAELDAAETKDPEVFSFTIKIKFGREIVLRSQKTYTSIIAAKAAFDRVRFLATLPESYEQTDNPNAQQYSFALVYKPVNYPEYLRRITESPEQFFERKNQFFNHLLRRFAEDFTDYTLLTFALSRKQGQLTDTHTFNQRFARDKANFLADYPNISRNRGQAFDYAANVLHPDNISGLERRIKRLIAIQPRPSKRLNYFEVAPYPENYFFEFKDLEGTVLFRSRLGYPTEAESQAAGNIFLELATIPAHYRVESCTLASAHSFKVIDANGCENAFHPETYGSAALRDEMMRYTQDVINSGGLVHTIASNPAGWVFHLKKDAAVLLQSAHPAKNRTKALQNLHRTTEAARLKKNYCPVNEPSGRGYSFEIAGGGRAVARHPVFYNTKGERDTAIASTLLYFADRNLPLEIAQVPSRYRWQLRDREANMLLHSIHFFKTEMQTAFSFFQAMQAASDGENFKKKRLAGGKFSFELLQRRKQQDEFAGENLPDHDKPIPIGVPPHPFDTEDACIQAIFDIIRLAQEFNGIDSSDWDREETRAGQVWESLRLNRAEGFLEEVKGEFFAQLRLPGANTPLLLVATTHAPTVTEAHIAFYEVLAAVRNKQFEDRTEYGKHPYGFDIRGENGDIIALHPIQYRSENERKTGKEDLYDRICRKSVDFDLENRESNYWFELWRKPHGKRLHVTLRGDKHKSAEAAEKAYTEVIGILKAGNGNIEDTTHTEDHASIFYGFRIKYKYDNKEHIANHLKIYGSAEQRRNAKQELIGFVTGWPIKNDGQSGLSPIDPICSCTNAAGDETIANPYTWRVLDDEERIARGARRFPNKALALQYAADISRQYLCRLPRWSAVWTDKDNYTGSGSAFFFALRDAQQYYWQSIQVFASPAEAQMAFTEQYLNILALARRPEAYHEHCREEGSKVFRLLDAAGQPVAESCPAVPAGQGLAAEMERLLDHARHYPVFRKGNYFSFRLYDPVYGDEFWKSLLDFNAPEAAMKGLRRFADLLLYRGNYQVVEMKCEWGIEIVEVLLESKPFYTSGISNIMVALHHTDVFMDRETAIQKAKEYRQQYLNQAPPWTSAWLDVEYNWDKQEEEAVQTIIIRDAGQRYWKPLGLDGKETGTLDQFDELFIRILKCAQTDSLSKPTQDKDGGDFIVELLSDDKETPAKSADDNKILAQSARRFKSDPEAQAEKERLIAHARHFPIFIKENSNPPRFCFGILDNPVGGGYLWTSQSDFASVKEAMHAFRNFLNLLMYERNYRIVGEANGPCHIEIVEGVQAGSLNNSSCDATENAGPLVAWAAVEQFLDTYSRMGDAIFEEYTDYYHCCGYGLRLVGEGYRLARLSASFHEISDREEARDILFEQSDSTAPEGPELLNWLLPENLSEKDVNIDLRLAIVNALRYADTYTVLTIKKGNTTRYRLGLIDPDGRPLLGFNDPLTELYKDNPNYIFFNTFNTEKDVVTAIHAHIIAANRLPVNVENSGAFRFVYRVKTGTELQPIKGLLLDECTPKSVEMPVFETKWESLQTYSQLAALWEKFNRFVALLDEKRAYARAEAADGSPTLMIVDPDFELAVHPRTYVTRAERESARQKLIDRLNTEGMHLLEHVLLRPRSTHDNDEVLMAVNIEPPSETPETVSGDDAFDQYIIGADPYSFMTTIVLPYWPNRFRDNDFRSFFENTLRRESPAHVLPRIIWVRPQQMKIFEKWLFRWLKLVGNDGCAKPMIAALQQLQNIFIDAYPLDCEGGGGNGNVIILDTTPIN